MYEHILQETIRLDNEIQTIQEQIETLPKGTLYISPNGKYSKWHVHDNECITYLSKSNRVYAQELAYKKYLLLRLEELNYEKESLQLYLNRQNNASCKSDLLLSSSSQFQELLLSYFKPWSTKQAEWMSTPFEKNPHHPEQLIHKTLSGTMVRSKSEFMIDSLLFLNKISYRYEALLSFDVHSFYPDFTIYLPKSDQLFYWEHFGLMDDPIYASHAYHKLEEYQKHNIIPSLNLITTFETKSSPLTIDTVEHMIKHYFM